MNTTFEFKIYIITFYINFRVDNVASLRKTVYPITVFISGLEFSLIDCCMIMNLLCDFLPNSNQPEPFQLNVLPRIELKFRMGLTKTYPNVLGVN